MRTWSRFLVPALLVAGLSLVLAQRRPWPAGIVPVAVAVLAVLAGSLTVLRESSHRVARAVGALQPAEPEPAAGRSDRVALLRRKLDQTLADTLQRGERVDVSVYCGPGQAIVVTDRRALVLRATPFRKNARVGSFPFHAILFAELRTNLNIQGGRLRIGLAGDSPAGPFAPVRPSWSGDETKFVDFSLEWQQEMEEAAALITERKGAAQPAVPASV